LLRYNRPDFEEGMSPGSFPGSEQELLELGPCEGEGELRPCGDPAQVVRNNAADGT